jgi:hypothetical protein
MLTTLMNVSRSTRRSSLRLTAPEALAAMGSPRTGGVAAVSLDAEPVARAQTAGPSEHRTASAVRPGPAPTAPLDDRSERSLIEQIIEINPTAQRDFLARFHRRDLCRYLEHLNVLARPRGRGSAWVRVPEAPAVITCACRD